ncbi:hypothetical protein JWZ98_09605 [Methylomonas sp. EFPC1]|uniref:hypothetical protein n=1 Tax=Methylomonas sp. EFPC1 TaxID=2812647 RepID=UPI00196843A7|nr:hypothetical protein [Methylomonas sp. EFPC1]QSB03153.1 hypothetical protein JWZ98_09595 [Methylomonas sp. EFPC1]QSB03155.1 hypothetical protein JWZ98_09605 [Methylomonas sp. EFPC1]
MKNELTRLVLTLNEIINYKQKICKEQILKENRRYNFKKKNLEEKRRERHKKMKRMCGIAEHRISYEDYKALILVIIETGKSGSTVLTKYAEEHNKGKEWRKTIARKGVARAFKGLMESYEEHSVIKKLIENKVYNKKSILKYSLTGALTELSKQIKLSNNIDKNKAKIEKLEKLINIKGESKNKSSVELILLAQKLRGQGWKTREIEKATGMSLGWVSKHTKPQNA